MRKEDFAVGLAAAASFCNITNDPPASTVAPPATVVPRNLRRVTPRYFEIRVASGDSLSIKVQTTFTGITVNADGPVLASDVCGADYDASNLSNNLPAQLTKSRRTSKDTPRTNAYHRHHAGDSPTFSFEFFPPQTPEAAETLYQTIRELEA